MQANATRFAIGLPGQVARCYVLDTLEGATRQLRTDEVAVPVTTTAMGVVIAADGRGIATRTKVDLAPITTAVQMPIQIPVPDRCTWTGGTKAYTGPQVVAFSVTGVVPVQMQGAWVGETTVTVLSAAAYQAWLIDQVKAEGERRSMLVMSPGGSKKSKYAVKDREVDNWYALGAANALTSTLLAAFALLNPADRARRFRFAIADAKAHGDTIDKAIARFAAGAGPSLDEVARLEGIEQAGVDRIRAASSSASKLAAFNAISWAPV